MKKKISSLNQQLKDFLSTMGISIKHASLLLIAFMSLVLTVLDLNGFDFGVIALVCWVFAFLDLARIKFKDYEIDFMNHKQTLTADERKLFSDNYELMKKFIFEIMKEGKVNITALDYVSDATQYAKLYLSSNLYEKLDSWAKLAREAFLLNTALSGNRLNEEKKQECIDREYEIMRELMSIDLIEVYQPYVRVKTDE